VLSFALHSVPRNPPYRVRSARLIVGLLFGLSLMFGMAGEATAQPPPPITCTGGQVPAQDLLQPAPAEQPDLRIAGVCKVQPGKKYFYANVNILDKGKLEFEESPQPLTDFWASSIIIENGGTMAAGTPGTPYGLKGGRLTIHLYGKASPSAIDQNGNKVPPDGQGQGVLCQSAIATTAPCGIPQKLWDFNAMDAFPGCGPTHELTDECIPGLPKTVTDFFYDYGPLYGDGKPVQSGPDKGKVGYFGYKTLAVSFGGTLAVYGYKGASYDPDTDNDHTSSGVSWIRLAEDLNPTDPSLTLATDPKGPGGMGKIEARWRAGDEIVVTTTDYLPGHSEKLTIGDDYPVTGGTTVPFTPAIQWTHIGKRFALAAKLAAAAGRLTIDPQLVQNGAETRAAVALLTRSIRIVSEGDGVVALPTPHIETFDEASARTLCPDGTTKGCYYFGAHMIVRQGFEKVQIQGVEFKQMGQGGRLGHYPVHFHMARQTPPDTFVKDSSINESMTRWYVIHSTQGVTLARNVGWRSIGHGYYLEDGTEANNNLYSNIGIFARAAINNAQNERQVPGILADNQGPFTGTGDVSNPGFPYRSDNEYPTVFWISNGWNNFQGDMAAGAGACGSAYWFVPLANSDTPDVPTATNQYIEEGPPLIITKHMKWADGGTTKNFGYAGLQRLPIWAGATPLKSFYSNYATSTMMSFQTTLDAPACAGFIAADAPPLNTPTASEIRSISPKPARKPKDDPPGTEPDLVNDTYYPLAIGARAATRCPVSAATNLPDCTPPNPGFSGLRTPCTDSTAFLVANPGKVDDPNNPEISCAPTVIDHFTSSFHWAQGDVSAIWLRPQWYLVANSVLSDVQQGGITFVTGGDLLRASIITGYWSLLHDSILIGHTQPQDAAHRFALDIGPFNLNTTEKCEHATGSTLPSYCLNEAAGVSLPLTGFFNNQRLENIYDGPSYRDSTAYLDVSTTSCPVGAFNDAVDTCIYGTQQTSGILNKTPTKPPSAEVCYVPNAAIAWKQPNGFFYPPAFHANNLFFGNEDPTKPIIRHFVIDPLFKAFDGSTSGSVQDFGQAGSYITDGTAVSNVYCLPPGVNQNTYFTGFTSIDRQTELNDDDGTLTGLSNNFTPAPGQQSLKQTISVNEDAFFTAPVETPECASNIGSNVAPGNACSSPSKNAPTVTAKTSPYDYVSTVIYHLAPAQPNPDRWDPDCTNPTCYGVPLYRQFLAGNDGTNGQPRTREWAHWNANTCNTDATKFGITKACRWPYIRMAGTAKSTRETLTINNGTYYIDTTVPLSIQTTEVYNTSGAGGGTLNKNVNLFVANGTYDVFLAYAKPTTHQTYQIYLGTNASTANVQPIQFRLDTQQVTTPSGANPWLTTKLATGGIVEVTVDFSKLPAGTLDPASANGLCQPRTFCTGTTSCTGAVTPTDPLAIADPDIINQANAVCAQWAVKDLDCPPSGCYGFSFTIPSTGFIADATINNPSPHRPSPVSFPATAQTGKPDWLVKFVGTTLNPDATAGGQCHYTTLPTYPPPGTGECTVPDGVPQ
jgi:cell migration-inducing and hyaluronan-binding protein